MFGRNDKNTTSMSGQSGKTLEMGLNSSNTLGSVVQSSISAKPGLTLKKTYTVNPGLILIKL